MCTAFINEKNITNWRFIVLYLPRQSKSTDTPVCHLVDFMGGHFLISVHTSSFGSILLLNLYGGTKKYFERSSSSDRSCLLLVRIAVQLGL